MTKQFTQKQKAYILWQGGALTPSALQRACKIPARTARFYIAEFNKGGTGERNDYSTRKNTKVTPRVVRKVISKAKTRTKTYSSRDIGTSFGLSHTTVQSILRVQGIFFKSFSNRLPLTPARREKRLNFAKKMQRIKNIWRKTVFTDEASFWLNRTRPGKVWTDDPNSEVGAASHGPKVHVWGCITPKGPLRLEIFEGNLDAEGYLAILHRRIPNIRKMFPEGWCWQQDGSGVHRAHVVQEYLDKYVPEKLDWPAYSPDLSPIENIWGWLKGQVAKDMPNSVDALKKSIRTHWNEINEEFLVPYFDSMPNRIAMVIENEGKKLNY